MGDRFKHRAITEHGESEVQSETGKLLIVRDAPLEHLKQQGYLGTFDEEKKETRHEILTVDDIFIYADVLQKTVNNYDEVKAEYNKNQITE